MERVPLRWRLLVQWLPLILLVAIAASLMAVVGLWNHRWLAAGCCGVVAVLAYVASRAVASRLNVAYGADGEPVIEIVLPDGPAR